jgi:hypothetical protein
MTTRNPYELSGCVAVFLSCQAEGRVVITNGGGVKILRER